ncbi:hypothetical protein SLITO_v1c05750 [Spiroplasma litorale]|uniref:Uncharacterized protein n=1 Tax=Spiroplasma litorale TaxID=216942 RepID=A0A0K1W201_9MOLU|nr:hypothetical protein SLITO_v1c05750 [Spiroplasma litorale]
MKTILKNKYFILLLFFVLFSTILLLIQLMLCEQIISLLIARYYVKLGKLAGLNNKLCKEYIQTFYPNILYNELYVYSYIF